VLVLVVVVLLVLLLVVLVLVVLVVVLSEIAAVVDGESPWGAVSARGVPPTAARSTTAETRRDQDPRAGRRAGAWRGMAAIVHEGGAASTWYARSRHRPRPGRRWVGSQAVPTWRGAPSRHHPWRPAGGDVVPVVARHAQGRWYRSDGQAPCGAAGALDGDSGTRTGRQEVGCMPLHETTREVLPGLVDVQRQAAGPVRRDDGAAVPEVPDVVRDQAARWSSEDAPWT